MLEYEESAPLLILKIELIIINHSKINVLVHFYINNSKLNVLLNGFSYVGWLNETKNKIDKHPYHNFSTLSNSFTPSFY
ncbi:hypothetical protein BpHYR1_030429 [Brachionus plicatilis]|uniref:Uncharacterized protein n=1 Tax=Brachionus plicatilis TaxID=10195 RepID=A0A3M7PQQ7_BRAPC|nr:hypothetical protein BpHYR1_030429 [Brachionus plicatilis]